MFLTGTECTMEGHCHLKPAEEARPTTTKTEPPKPHRLKRITLILKTHRVCPPQRQKNVPKCRDHMKSLSPCRPHASPLPTQTSALRPYDRTAVPYLCLLLMLQQHFPTTSPPQPPLPTRRKVEGSCDHGIGKQRSSGWGRLLELFFAVTQIAQSFS